MQLPAATLADRRKLSPPAGSKRHSTAAGDAADPADSPLAFTVDFGPADKRLHVKDSISRWAPRTRRPAAASKDDREEVRGAADSSSCLIRPRLWCNVGTVWTGWCQM